MNWRVAIPMILVVLVIWVVGAAVTKYSLEQMAYLAPIAVVVVGAQIGVVMLWVKIVRDSAPARARRSLLTRRVDRRSVRGGTYRGCMVASWKIEPVSFADVRALSAELGVSETVATVLIRRGLGDRDAARAFLEPEGITHDPLLLGDMATAVERIRQAVDARRPDLRPRRLRRRRDLRHRARDPDAAESSAPTSPGTCRAGSRKGYGVSAATIAQLADAGVKLILTVDCGITAVAEVEEARRLGVDMIVTDHHRPGETLPDCPIVATRPSDYPFPDLCGTGVVAKLAQALLGPSTPS